MELGLREWLIIGGVIVVLLIVLDGWRRMRGSGNRLKMKIDKSLADLPEVVEESSFNPELPGGGARVANANIANANTNANKSGDVRADARREPAFGRTTSADKTEPSFSDARTAEAHVEPSFNSLDLSPVRKVEPEVQPAASAKAQSAPELKSELKPELKLGAHKPEVSKEPLATPAADKPQPEYEIPSLLTDVADEQDPLFAPADSFPPHHDGPSFDEMDEGVSAVRVVRTAEPETLVEIESAEPSRTDSINTVDDSDIVDDIPMIQSIVQPEPEVELEAELEVELEPETAPLVRPVEATDQPDIDDMFSAEEVVDKRRPAAYAVEEDDLIDSLPEGFRSETRDDIMVDEDEHEFDYTRPVSELMRPKRDDHQPLQQASMDLPEHQERAAPLRKAEPSVQSKPRYEAPIEPAHFSAIDDDEQTELTGLFTDESANVAAASRDEPTVSRSNPSADHGHIKQTAEAQDKAESAAMGIKGQSLQKIPEADKVLVISVVATEGEQSFSGRNLLQILLACGMRYGDMKIFHRYEDGIDKGAIQFSMTNALEPGYFDIDTMDSIETRGVTFFMSMEEPRDVMNAYECMLATASAVAANLNGVLLDENRSTMRNQTKEHYRERIRKFEMRKLKKTTTA
ncbi:cell division protein ZipA [Amphritea opalescens]|uniref:Cell division protein ZipA n=1 Tax=Amphritea opalescens TaxID=2490544 RepID=A0A430KTE4_9GAMM|nr:cell division protein ZipA [Amphritea opalescens]RTE66815.1 cell division protein ZipA [Amphritea opalescens]